MTTVTAKTTEGHEYPTIPCDLDDEETNTKIVQLVGEMVVNTKNLESLEISDDDGTIRALVTVKYNPHNPDCTYPEGDEGDCHIFGVD